ncbi:uncharacterized protein [Rutidosis leptorrhynchoides]|uniref:uncharacterized protein isoform X2 n=1 Tax=Rutidosis leptorrhynchoides TaxID=125765 RepID=UPI003A99E94C
MKTLTSNSISIPQFLTTYTSNFSSISRKNHIFINFRTTKPFPRYNITTSCSYSDDYGGWDDLSSGDDPGESTQLHKLLSSLGIDDKRYAFVYLLGFVCALAVSRVRVSSIVVFPACFLVFAGGFSFGVLNKSDFNKVTSLFGDNGGKKNKKKRLKDDEFRVSVENLKTLLNLLSGFDVNVKNLKSNMRKDVDCNRISKRDLISYIEGMESIEQGVLQAKSMIDGYMDSMVVESNDGSKATNQISSDKKEMEGKRLDFSQLIAGFRQRSFGSNPTKVKDSAKNDARKMEVSDHNEANIVDPLVNDLTIDDKNANNDGDVRVRETYRGKSMVRKWSMEMESDGNQVFDRDEYVVTGNKMRYVKSERLAFDMNNENMVETWESDDDLLDSNVGASYKQRSTEEMFQQELGNFKKFNGNNMLYDDFESRKTESFDDPRIKNDIIFNDYVTEANLLLKEAREWLKHKGIEEDAENMLYKSTELLSKAIDMNPMSLLAVGQLGNTYLLHGELKLKLSRKLRTFIAQNESEEFSNRKKFVDYLVNVCEECEELLVKAGRKYRLALSIDGDDMRALYNWGIALSFRAQLIADIGPLFLDGVLLYNKDPVYEQETLEKKLSC